MISIFDDIPPVNLSHRFIFHVSGLRSHSIVEMHQSPTHFKVRLIGKHWHGAVKGKFIPTADESVES